MFEESSHCLLTVAQESAFDFAACSGYVVVSHTGFAAPDLVCLDGPKIDAVGWSEFPCRLGSAAVLAAYVASFAAAAAADVVVVDVVVDDVDVGVDVVDVVDVVVDVGVAAVAGGDVAGAVVAAEESCSRRSLEIHPWNWPSCSSG